MTETNCAAPPFGFVSHVALYKNKDAVPHRHTLSVQTLWSLPPGQGTCLDSAD